MNNFAGKLGIVRTRDLVELYFGARFVVTVKESIYFAAQVVQILQQDTRRIGYEVIISAQSNVPALLGFVLSANQDTAAAGNGQTYIINTAGTIIIKRNWLSDAEGVTLPLFANMGGAGTISVRETFLTPPPVDEDLTD